MSARILKFVRRVNGVSVEQRKTDGFINGTAMCVAHGKDISDWLVNKSTFELLDALVNRLGQPVNRPDKIKDRNSGDLSATRLAAIFPSVLTTKRGSPVNGGGVWIHPKLAVHLAQWVNPQFALLVSDWVEEWMMTGRNPVQMDLDQEWTEWQQRYDIRIELKDFLRPELMSAVAHWAKEHGQSPVTLCSKVHDAMNERIQGAKAKYIRAVSNLPLGVLLRDYFSASPLTCYSAINRIAKNNIEDRNMEPLQAVQDACDRYLGKTYLPKMIPIVENLYAQGHRLKAMRRRRQLEQGQQLSLFGDTQVS